MPFLRRKSALGSFQDSCFSPSPAKSIKDSLIFTLKLWSGSWKQNSWKYGAPLRLDPMEFFKFFLTLNLVHIGPTVTHQLHFKCFYSYWFLLLGFFSQYTVILSICLAISNLGGRSLPCDLNSLMDLWKVVDFHFVCFFSCKDVSDNFQTFSSITF